MSHKNPAYDLSPTNNLISTLINNMYVVSDNVISQGIDRSGYQNNPYEKVTSFTLPPGGYPQKTIRLHAIVTIYVGAGNVTIKAYRNGVGIGSELLTAPAQSPADRTLNAVAAWTPGDTIELWAHNSDGVTIYGCLPDIRGAFSSGFKEA